MPTMLEPSPKPRRSLTGVSPARRQLAENLRAARKTARLSQRALAAQAGIDRTTIMGIEAGRHNASVDVLDRIAAVLGVALPDLLVARHAGT